MPLDPALAAPVASCTVAPTTGYIDQAGTQETDPPAQGGQFDVCWRAGPGSSSANMPNGAALCWGTVKTGAPPAFVYFDDATISNVRLIGAPPPIVVPTPLAPGVYVVK